PASATAGAAALDSRAHAPGALRPGERALLPTRLAVAIPPGHEGQVRPRSGLALRHGITCLNSPGTIDSDYRGEVCVILANLGQEEVSLARGERIAQLIIAPVSRAQLVEVTELPGTAGGDRRHRPRLPRRKLLRRRTRRRRSAFFFSLLRLLMLFLLRGMQSPEQASRLCNTTRIAGGRNASCCGACRRPGGSGTRVQ